MGDKEGGEGMEPDYELLMSDLPPVMALNARIAALERENEALRVKYEYLVAHGRESDIQMFDLLCEKLEAAETRAEGLAEALLKGLGELPHTAYPMDRGRRRYNGSQPGCGRCRLERILSNWADAAKEKESE